MSERISDGLFKSIFRSFLSEDIRSELKKSKIKYIEYYLTLKRKIIIAHNFWVNNVK